RQVALSYQKKYPNLIRVLYSEKNIGPNKNLARVLSHCRGQFVAICEGDDYWVDTTKLEKEVCFFLNNPEYVVTYHRNIVVDSYGLVIKDNEENSRPWQDYSRDELIMAAFMPTLTMCFRNIIGELPPEFFKVLNADRFLRSILGQYGCAKYLQDIKPSAYRVHGGGIWSGISTAEQRIARSTTLFWLSIYYRRIGEIDVSNRYSLKSLECLISSLAFDNVAKRKFLLKQILPKFNSIFENIKRIL
ncbi:MAG: glycosyltransferase, partial [Flavitalea sp.]